MFRRIDETMWVSGQLQPADVAQAAAEGVTMIVNNRPDGEQIGQPTSAEIEAATKAAGIAYRYIPVGGGGLSQNQVTAMAEALDAAEGPVLGFCAAGMRATFLWALARAGKGEDAETLMKKAAAAGYDLTPIRPYLG